MRLKLSILLCLMPLAACSSAPPPVEHEAQYDAIIIGGGLAGLSAGTHLALGNLKVLLLEQHDKVGGCATRFERGDFTFEVSLHAMSGGGPGRKERGLRKLLKAAGVAEKVELIEIEDLYRSIFPGLDITVPNNWADLKKVVAEKWPEEMDGFETFQTLCGQTKADFMSMRDMFRHRGIKLFWNKALVPFTQPTFYKYKERTFQEVLDECFKAKELKSVLGQLWLFYGPTPAEQSALIGLAATDSYLSDGPWHIKGTSQALSNAYAERISELGGTVMTDTLVSKIIIEGGVAKGVETASGKTYTGRYIIANTDPYQLTHELVGKEHFPESYKDRLNELKPSNSLFGIYLGLNIDLKERGYRDTEIFFNTSLDASSLYKNMMRGHIKGGAAAITIYTNMNDPIYAPPGKSVVSLATYSDAKNWPKESKGYESLKDQKTDELIALAAKVIPELADEQYIEVKESYTPWTISRFTKNKDGIVYGFEMTPDQWTKIPHETPIDNIYITSNWSQTWHGMGPAQVNGWRAARLVLDRERIK